MVEQYPHAGEQTMNSQGYPDKFIVLVDDNPDDEMLTIRALKKNNVENDLVVLRDGAEALEFFLAMGAYAGRNMTETPALILLDLKLPKFSGLEILEKLRKHADTRLIPIVVLTTSNEELDVINSYQLGANSYIRKPVDFNEFTVAIRKITDYWLSLNCQVPKQEK
jgi:two-component system response regulator